jgi:hypothetical protein
MNLSAYEQFGFTLIKSGSYYKMCCPFHKEDTPSFVVYPDLSYHCFGCHAHGSYEDFIMFFSGDSNRIFYVRSLDDIQVTREEKEFSRLKHQLETQIAAVVKDKDFEIKERTWNKLDKLFVKASFMKEKNSSFMHLVLFMKKEGNILLDRVLNER